MPVHLRNLYYRQHGDLVEKKNKEVEKANQQSKQPTIPRMFKPQK